MPLCSIVIMLNAALLNVVILTAIKQLNFAMPSGITPNVVIMNGGAPLPTPPRGIQKWNWVWLKSLAVSSVNFILAYPDCHSIIVNCWLSYCQRFAIQSRLSSVDCQRFTIESWLSAVDCWLWNNFENGSDHYFLILHCLLSDCQRFAIQSRLWAVHCWL